MVFSEIYGSYFQVLSAILAEAVEGRLTGASLTERVREKAFSESTLAIPAALRQKQWPLLDDMMHTVLHHKPTMPVTMLEKRWLKALLSDPRIALFAPDTTGLEDVEPLYSPDVFVYYDRYNDGDPYSDETYIRCFRTLLRAVREGRCLQIGFRSRSGAARRVVCRPYQLEYSAKDDKFRLLAVSEGRLHMLNVARIRTCELLEPYDPAAFSLPRDKEVELTMLLHDERNALERVLLHFSHFEKTTRKLDEQCYEIKLWYDKSDETELLIRVLSFGPMLEVRAPADFLAHLKRRISAQREAFSPKQTTPQKE